MGKYRDHRERRGKRHANDQGGFSDQAPEPSYFQVAPRETSDPVDAEVLWFNADKGFGFVRLPDGTEAYLHIHVLEAAGGNDLQTGAHLKVVTEVGARGRQVVKVLHIGELGRQVAPVNGARWTSPRIPLHRKAEVPSNGTTPKRALDSSHPKAVRTISLFTPHRSHARGSRPWKTSSGYFFSRGRARREWRFDPFALPSRLAAELRKSPLPGGGGSGLDP